MMKEIIIEKGTVNKKATDIFRGDVYQKIDRLKEYISSLFIYTESIEGENDKLREEKARLYAENAALRKQLDLKEKKEEKAELDDIYKKLKELREQKLKFEKELDKCMMFCQEQYDYDDLK